MITLDCYTFTWNEERLLPKYLAYYGPLCRRILVYDDASTDKTVEILKAHPKVELRSLEVEKDSCIETQTALINQIWRESIGKVDWVLLNAVDEFVGPDLLGALQKHKDEGHIIVKPRGYDLLAEKVTDKIRMAFSPYRTKPSLFRPDLIAEINFHPGAHVASFLSHEGEEIPQIEKTSLEMRHYRYIGREETWQRYQELNKKRRHGDWKQAFGHQYGYSREEFDEEFDFFYTRSEEMTFDFC